MFYTQSNTKQGSRDFVAAAGLLAKEGLLVVGYSNAGVATVKLPTATTDSPQYLLVDDGLPQNPASDPGGQVVHVLPLDPERNIRIRAYGAGTAGTVLVMADPTANAGAQAGMVTALPATAGKYQKIGVAEEDFVDGQLVLLRPDLGGAIVSTAVALTSVQNATAAAVDLASSEALANALKASFNALQTDVAALRAALITNGQIH